MQQKIKYYKNKINESRTARAIGLEYIKMYINYMQNSRVSINFLDEITIYAKKIYIF